MGTRLALNRDWTGTGGHWVALGGTGRHWVALGGIRVGAETELPSAGHGVASP